jgi:hypothetical protein
MIFFLWNTIKNISSDKIKTNYQKTWILFKFSFDFYKKNLKFKKKNHL